MGMIRRLFGSKNYLSNPNHKSLSEYEIAAINIGAINSEQTSSYCDSIETGLKRDMLIRNLSNAYGIDNRDSAMETLQWLDERGHHICFEAIKEFVAGKSNAIKDDALTDDEKSSMYAYINNVRANLKTLIENQYMNDPSELSDASILAWDMGRLVFVARCCYDVGYLTKEETWEYIERAYLKSQSVYKNWDAFGKGYILGRCMWTQDYIMPALIGIHKRLMKDQESPWNTFEFIQRKEIL